MELTRSMPMEVVTNRSPTVCQIATFAVNALKLEVLTWPKPGLVSHVDSGSHHDMNATTLFASADALRPYFAELFEAAAADAPLHKLQSIGRSAEKSMRIATCGVNTHRGAVFTLGLLCAAAGRILRRGEPIVAGSLGATVRKCWGEAISSGPCTSQSHGVEVSQRYNAGGARAEAADGFPHIYQVGLPALGAGRSMASDDANAARVQTCFALIADLQDTNLLYRGGLPGLCFAQSGARSFLMAGGVSQKDWRRRAAKIHASFVARQLSPGGSADLLAATLLVDLLEMPRMNCTPCISQEFAIPAYKGSPS
jgi:triphosphoribosyl-dephospho-CoA synthase